MTESAPLPSFRRPPVVETVLGFEFRPLEHWGVPHFGLFWDRIREAYPLFEVHPPVARPEGSASGGLVLELGLAPHVRCWFLREQNDRLIQVQNNRFIHNWRKVGSASEYPRYESIRPTFLQEWQRFTEFLSEAGVEAPEITACEVTYVNQFEKGREWRVAADLADVVTFLDFDREGNWLGGAKTNRCSLAFPVEGKSTSLLADLVHAIRNVDGREIFQLSLTARGTPPTHGKAIEDWLDDARETVVRGFAHLTTGPMHQLWERES